MQRNNMNPYQQQDSQQSSSLQQHQVQQSQQFISQEQHSQQRISRTEHTVSRQVTQQRGQSRKKKTLSVCERMKCFFRE